MLRRTFIQGLSVVPFLGLAGCNGSVDASELLNLIVIAADAAISGLSGVVIPQALATLITTYLGEVQTFVNFAITETESTDTAADKISKIIAEAAMFATPDLNGVPLVIANLVNAVAKAIASYLDNLKTVSTILVNNRWAATFANGKKLKIDKKKLEDVRKKNQALKAKLGK
jgi:hypothetical protein